MKNKSISTKPQKLRVLATGDIYYTFKHWEPKDVDGVTFLPVNKFDPSQNKTQVIYYMRKDAMEYIK